MKCGLGGEVWCGMVWYDALGCMYVTMVCRNIVGGRVVVSCGVVRGRHSGAMLRDGV